jgi:hypothetical protein
MARSAPTYDSGTIPSAPSGNITLWWDKLIEKLTEHQSNGEDAWELADQINTGVDYEAVFHSVGDRTLGSGTNKGDTDIWIQLHRRTVNTMEMRIAQDYSPTTGVWLTGAYHDGGSGDFASSMDDLTQIDWWSVCNEYEFHFIWVQGGVYKTMCFGSLIRPYSAALNGVARITSQSGTGNGVVIGVDRDITSNIAVGQTLWLLNQTPDATGIQSVGIDPVTVTAKAAGSITVDGVTNTYAVGSLIGMDPCPSFVKNTNSATAYFCQNMDSTWTGAGGQYGNAINSIAAALTEADFDPGVDQLYYGGQPFVKMGLIPNGFRGKFQHARAFTYGTQADQDIMQIDYDSAQQWKLFASTGANWFTGYVTAFGPGAS